jgi:hypothetical protein
MRTGRQAAKNLQIENPFVSLSICLLNSDYVKNCLKCISCLHSVHTQPTAAAICGALTLSNASGAATSHSLVICVLPRQTMQGESDGGSALLPFD